MNRPRPDAPLEMRFRWFCEEHPHVETAIVDLARKAKAKGLKRWSVKAAGFFEPGQCSISGIPI